MAAGQIALAAALFVGLCLGGYMAVTLRCVFLNQYLNRSKGISMAKTNMTEKPIAATRRIKGVEIAKYL